MNARNPGFVSSLGHRNQHQAHRRGRSGEDSCNSQLHLSSPLRQEADPYIQHLGCNEWMNWPAEVSLHPSEVEMVLASVENTLENKHMICYFKRQAVSVTQVHGLCQLFPPPRFRWGLSRGWNSFFSLHRARKSKPRSLSHTFTESACTLTGRSSLHYPSNLAVACRFDHSWICRTETSGEVKHTAAMKDKSSFWV